VHLLAASSGKRAGQSVRHRNDSQLADVPALPVRSPLTKRIHEQMLTVREPGERGKVAGKRRQFPFSSGRYVEQHDLRRRRCVFLGAIHDN